MAPHTDISKYMYTTSDNNLYGIAGQVGNMVQSITGQSYYVNSVFDVASAVSSGSPEQMVNAGQSLIMRLLNKYLGGKAAVQKAKQTVKAKEDEINVEGKKTDAKINKNESDINEIISEAQEKASEIESKLKEIKDKEEEKKQIEDKLAEYKATIEANKAILEDSSATDEEKDTARKLIEEAGANISALAGDVETLSKNIDEANDEITTIQMENVNLNDLAIDLEAENAKLFEETNRMTQQMLQNINIEFSQATAQNEAAAVQLEAQATALETGGALGSVLTFGASNVASQAEAAKLLADAGLYHTAAGEFTSGITSTTATGNTEIFQPLALGLSSFNSYMNNCMGYIGSTNSKINDGFDMTNALGSSWISEENNLEQTGENIQLAVNSKDNGNSDNNKLEKPLEELENIA